MPDSTPDSTLSWTRGSLGHHSQGRVGADEVGPAMRMRKHARSHPRRRREVRRQAKVGVRLKAPPKPCIPRR